MFQKINNIGPPLRLSEGVSYILNGINSGNGEMKVGNMTIKTDHIGMALDFEASVVHLSNCID